MTDLNPYRPPLPEDPVPAVASDPVRMGKIPQIRAVAAVMFFQGLLSCGLAVCLCSFIVLLRFDGDDPSEGIVLQILTLLSAICGFVSGFTYIAAATLNFFFRSHRFGVIALWVGLLSVFTCACGPTAIAVMIYGAIVYYDKPVIAAFRYAETGRSVEETLTAAHEGRL